MANPEQANKAQAFKDRIAPEFGDVNTAIRSGMILATPSVTEPGGIPFTVAPEGSELINLEAQGKAPARKRGDLTFHDAASFSRYVKTFATASTTIFADFQSGAYFTAVLDYHDPHGAPGWREHRASFKPVPTREYGDWVGRNKVKQSQKEFALFIEDHLPEIVEPSSATIMEMSRNLYVKSNAEFSSAIRTDNGNEALNYIENTETTIGKTGTIPVPNAFAIGIGVFEGGEKYKINARLRHSIADKKLSFTYELVNIHMALRDALNELMAKIKEGTGIEPFLGRHQ